MIASAVGRFDTIGIDLVAMCADDVVCTGAEPLAFLDYVAVGRLDPVDVAELVGSVAAGCREAGAELVGGETAEHPGHPRRRGVRPRGLLHRRRRTLAADRRLRGPRRRRDPRARLVRAALQRLLADPLADRANGTSTSPSRTRRACDARSATPQTDRLLAAAPNEAMATLGDVLLTPTRIYARAILAARERRTTSTGSRTSPAAACRATCRGRCQTGSPRGWTRPLADAVGDAVVRRARRAGRGGAPGDVQRRDRDDRDRAAGRCRGRDRRASPTTGSRRRVVGEVVAAAATDGRRYVEGALESVA